MWVCHEQVREVAAEAIARARRGDGPTLIEAETYRFRGHSLADPDELRQKEEKDHYAVRRFLDVHWGLGIVSSSWSRACLRSCGQPSVLHAKASLGLYPVLSKVN